MIQEILIDDDYTAKLIWYDADGAQQIRYLLLSHQSAFAAFIDRVNREKFINICDYEARLVL